MKKNTDTIPAKLTPREAVLNRNAAELLGRDTIKRLNDHGNMLMKRGVDLAGLQSDPAPYPASENLAGLQMGTSDVGRDDRADLLKDAENTFYGGGTAPMPTPTPTPAPRGYAYGDEDVRRRRTNATSRLTTNYSTFGRNGVQVRSGNTALAPEDNPEYQAAIANGRPSRSGYTMIQTPSGGSMSVPIGQERKYTDLLFKGNPTTNTGFQRPDPTTAYALGNTGAVPTGNTPYARSFRMGSNIDNPVQQPQPSFGYQVGQAAQNLALGVVPFAQNAASRIASFFGGGNTPNIIPSANALPPAQNTFTTQRPEDNYGFQYGTSDVPYPRRYSDYY